MALGKKLIEMNCKYCEKVFMQYPSQVRNANRVFCSKPCWYKWKSVNIPSWNKGTRGLVKPNSGSFKKGQHASPSTEFKKGMKVGPLNNLWKGGITPINTRIRQSDEYKTWRKSVFERDDYTCQICFVRGVEIHADHIKPFSIFKDLRFDISNGRTLCVPCHKNTETYLKRFKKEEVLSMVGSA